MTTAIKDHPILFSTSMVQAILRPDNPKTQTRRVIKPQPEQDGDGRWLWNYHYASYQPFPNLWLEDCLYGVKGDQLWVRETWAADEQEIVYKADDWYDNESPFGRWRPSIHMSRLDSRITLEIVKVRAERLHNITEADAIAEGAGYWRDSLGMVGLKHKYPEWQIAEMVASPILCFSKMWDEINAKRGFGWATNPYVWVIEFKLIKP